MGTILLASCRNPPVDPDDDPRLAHALQKEGCEAVIRPWTDITPVAARGCAAVVLRSTWDYHRNRDRFLAWLDSIERQGVPVLNPSSLVRSCIDKSYLARGRPFGCPVPETLCVPARASDIRREVRARSWQYYVLKPPVSASAEGTCLLHADDTAGLERALRLQSGPVLLQEFLPEIRDGELSLIFFDGWFSHAVRKIPAAGDFRVQAEFGSRTVPFRPPAPVIAAARTTLRHLPEMACYARVDGVMRNGEFLLMELELIEPELFLRHSPSADEIFARAILARLRKMPASITSGPD